jgi:hypothetical protein
MNDTHGCSKADRRVLVDAPLFAGAAVLAVGPPGVKATIHEVKAARALVHHPGSYGAADELIAASAHEADTSHARLDTKRHMHAEPDAIADSLLDDLGRVPAVPAQPRAVSGCAPPTRRPPPTRGGTDGRVVRRRPKRTGATQRSRGAAQPQDSHVARPWMAALENCRWAGTRRLAAISPVEPDD